MENTDFILYWPCIKKHSEDPNNRIATPQQGGEISVCKHLSFLSKRFLLFICGSLQRDFVCMSVLCLREGDAEYDHHSELTIESGLLILVHVYWWCLVWRLLYYLQYFFMPCFLKSYSFSLKSVILVKFNVLCQSSHSQCDSPAHSSCSSI